MLAAPPKQLSLWWERQSFSQNENILFLLLIIMISCDVMYQTVLLTDHIVTSLFIQTSRSCSINVSHRPTKRPRDRVTLTQQHDREHVLNMCDGVFTHTGHKKIAYYAEHTASISFTTSTSASTFDFPHVILRGFGDIWLGRLSLRQHEPTKHLAG